jgi:hypothetical protein
MRQKASVGIQLDIFPSLFLILLGLQAENNKIKGKLPQRELLLKSLMIACNFAKSK